MSSPARAGGRRGRVTPGGGRGGTGGEPSARFRLTRAAHRDETAQDYVEAIARLESEQGSARVGDLSRHMGVSHVTVSRTLSRLGRLGLVRAERRRPVELTAAGRRLAERIRRRHETVRAFLVWIGVPGRQAEIDAEGLEHHASEATIRAMRRLVGSGPGRGGRG